MERTNKALLSWFNLAFGLKCESMPDIVEPKNIEKVLISLSMEHFWELEEMSLNSLKEIFWEKVLVLLNSYGQKEAKMDEWSISCSLKECLSTELSERNIFATKLVSNIIFLASQILEKNQNDSPILRFIETTQELSSDDQQEIQDFVSRLIGDPESSESSHQEEKKLDDIFNQGTLLKKIDELESKCFALEKENKKMVDETKNKEKAKQEALDEVSRLSSLLKQTQGSYEALQGQIGFNEGNEEMRKEQKRLNSVIEKQEKHIQRLQKENQEIGMEAKNEKKKASEAEKKLTEERKRHEMKRWENENLTQDKKETLEELSSKEKELLVAKARVQNLEGQLKTLREEFGQKKKEASVLQIKVAEFQEEITEKNSKIRDLEERVMFMEENGRGSAGSELIVTPRRSLGAMIGDADKKTLENEFKDYIKKLDEEVLELKKEKETLDLKLLDLDDEFSKSKAQNEVLRSQNKKLEAQLQSQALEIRNRPSERDQNSKISLTSMLKSKEEAQCSFLETNNTSMAKKDLKANAQEPMFIELDFLYSTLQEQAFEILNLRKKTERTDLMKPLPLSLSRFTRPS